MRKSRPLRWIEEAEARRVLARVRADMTPPIVIRPSWVVRLRVRLIGGARAQPAAPPAARVHPMRR
jgi:hypothetical protein